MRRRLFASAFALAGALGLCALVARAEEPLPQLPPANDAGPAPSGTLAPGELVAGPAPASSSTMPPAEAAARKEEEEARRFRPAFRFAGGYQLGRAHGISANGARFRAGVGAQNDSSAHYAMLSALYGETEQGLRAWDIRLGWCGDFLRWKILRAGVDIEFGYLVVRRATLDARMWALGMGIGGHVGVDVFPFGPRDDHAITIEGRFDGHLHFGNALYWGPSILVGVRF